MNRRQFNKNLISLGFAGLAQSILPSTSFASGVASRVQGYGALLSDPNGLLDLPQGFSYKVLSRLGDTMSDGHKVPDDADGMGVIALEGDRIALVRNHEVMPKGATDTTSPIKSDLAYSLLPNGHAMGGGTTTLIVNQKTNEVERQFWSVAGTIRNCAGGVTPWGSWLTCEEIVIGKKEGLEKDHGFVFEVPADSDGLVKAEPLVAMGRFNHEAACVDPNTGIVYMTEDRKDSLFYRFIPKVQGELNKGGQLQALVVKDQPKFDTRNWHSPSFAVNQTLSTEWVDLDNPESPDDDLRVRGHDLGAAVFARGEGLWWGDDELYFTCTSGGAKKLGQVMRYVPKSGQLSLFLESPDKQTFNFGDNLTVAPNGHLIVCEDQYGSIVDNKLKGITPKGLTYNLAGVRVQTEPAGACFSPDGETLYVNLYSPTVTLAITGPWASVSEAEVS